MKISYSWLKEFVDIDLSPAVLAEKLTMAGIEVEDIIPLEPGFTNVVVGEILSIEKHPNADRLSLCKVTTGQAIYHIVCGAKNMKEGDKVALALPGSILPGGVKIERAIIRGVESQGMMCSQKELGVGEDGANLLILPPDTEVGRDVADVMGLRDTIIDLAITPNRGDCLSVIGMAREVAAITGAEFKDLTPVEEGEEPVEGWIEVEIKDRELCPRYTAKIADGVSVGPSPLWLKCRLEALGFRSINNVVDITNYVMLERGQPLHAFDYSTIEGRELIIRRAREGEKIVTLDGVERKLTLETLVIADSKKPVAIAGVMGGLNSEVTEGTGTVLLESAHFNPSSVRRTAKGLGLSTESSYRFERGVDPGDNVKRSIERAAFLIKILAGGKVVTKTLDLSYLSNKHTTITLRPERMRGLIGMDVDIEEAIPILGRLGAKSSEREGTLIVQPPSFRMDLKEEIDLIEEIIRIKGYGEVPETLPEVRVTPILLKRDQIFERRIRETFRIIGFSEVINYSFLSPDLLQLFGLNDNTLSIINPLTTEQSAMRPSLLPGLLENVRYNQSHKNTDLRLFELGKVFLRKGKEERRKVAALWTGLRWKELWGRGKEKVDIFDLKGVVEGLLESIGIQETDFRLLKGIPFIHPLRCYAIIADKKEIGVMGEIHPDINHKLEIRQPVFVFEIDLEDLLKIESPPGTFRPIPKYPPVVRDISFLVDDTVPAGSIRELIRGIDSNIKEVSVFDLYKGKGVPEGKKSLGIRITYLSEKKTLTEEEVNTIHAKVIEKLKEAFQISIR